jgi:hypothetical protein
MSSAYDHQTEARAAMEMAAAATTEPERSKWVRIALAWQDLARSHEPEKRDPARPGGRASQPEQSEVSSDHQIHWNNMTSG